MSSVNKTIGLALRSPSVNDEAYERQLASLRSFPVDEILTEQAGHDQPWQIRTALIEGSEKGTAIAVERIEYFARSTRELATITARLRERGIRLIVVSFAGRLLRDNDLNNFNLADLAMGMAEFESGRARQRNVVGLRAARSKGRLIGRPPIPPELEGRITALHAQGGFSASGLAQSLGISRATVFRVLRKVRQH